MSNSEGINTPAGPNSPDYLRQIVTIMRESGVKRFVDGTVEVELFPDDSPTQENPDAEKRKRDLRTYGGK